MRIAQIATVSTPVRRDHAGSVETVVWLLARELTRAGHDVTVFGCAGAECDGRFVETLPGPYGEAGSPDDWNLCEWLSVAKAVARSREFDVMHCHSYMWGLPFAALAACPLVHTLHILPYDQEAQLWRMEPAAHVTAISRFQWSAYPDLHPCAVIPHGVDVEQFRFVERPGDDLVYLGRFIENKGPLDAVRVARQLGRRLILAGPRSDYFTDHVEPLVDDDEVVWVGPVDAAGRRDLLGRAAALVYPLREPEPFGLVQIEAMLCGTPVAATSIGAVPEIVDDGVTGALATSADDLSAAINRCVGLDRWRVQQSAAARFTSARMAADYAGLYGRLASTRASPTR
jgi:glycosyltransferase involved in cell wall biosynthesis